MRKAGSQRTRKAASRSDVARLAGVAPSTVSLVLNNTPGPRIPDETRKRVVAAAESLGYRSSSIAKALVTGRTHTVGVVLHFVGRPFIDYSARVLDGCWLALQERGYRLLMVRGGADACVAGLFRERSVDGIVVVAAPHQADDAELVDLAASGFPTVFIGSRPQRAECEYVDIDNAATAREATARLIRAGHRAILHLAGPLGVNSAAVDRLAGYRQALADAGLPFRDELVIDGSFNPEIAGERLDAALAGGLRFSAVFSANESMGYGAVRVLEAHGLRVPDDVAMICIDRDTYVRGEPHLETYEQPLDAIGRRAGTALIERIEGLDGPPRSLLLPCRPVPGASLAPPRA